MRHTIYIKNEKESLLSKSLLYKGAILKVTFARNFLILLFQLSVANPENFEKYKVRAEN